MYMYMHTQADLEFPCLLRTMLLLTHLIILAFTSQNSGMVPPSLYLSVPSSCIHTQPPELFMKRKTGLTA